MPLSAQTAKTILFTCFVGPGPVIGLIPWLISGWRFHWVYPVIQPFGALLFVVGLIPLADSISRFVKEGRGTPAPYSETDQLVVNGFYRYVRNPMYVGVVSMIFGQSLFLWNRDIFIYALASALGFHLFVTLYEEPRLRQKYGSAYATYQQRVRRWLPHLHAAQVS